MELIEPTYIKTITKKIRISGRFRSKRDTVLPTGARFQPTPGYGFPKRRSRPTKKVRRPFGTGGLDRPAPHRRMHSLTSLLVRVGHVPKYVLGPADTRRQAGSHEGPAVRADIHQRPAGDDDIEFGTHPLRQ